MILVEELSRAKSFYATESRDKALGEFSHRERERERERESERERDRERERARETDRESL